MKLTKNQIKRIITESIQDFEKEELLKKYFSEGVDNSDLMSETEEETQPRHTRKPKVSDYVNLNLD